MSSIPPEDDLDATRVATVGELQKELELRTKRDRPCLIVLAGSNVGEMYRIEAAETVVGRASNATIRLNDDGISRRHARVLQAHGRVLVEDMQSANGTYLNGQRVFQPIALNDGDKVRLGSTTVLKFTYHDQLDESFQQQMYDAALRDGLTKAYNKTYFLDRLQTEFAYAKRHQADLSLLMFDVDHFKRVNDTYGHLAGDYVLAKISKLAHSTVRSEDLFARYGGEEFAVLCRAVQLSQAGILAERIRSVVESTTFEYEGRKMPVTISVGVAAHPNTPLNHAIELIGAADEALYEAKRCGRNRVLLKQG